MDINELYENIIEYGIATEEELQLVTDVAGYSFNTLNDVIYSRTGYNDWEQYREDY